MLTAAEEKEARDLFQLGYSISAISRHLGRDRATIRAYLRGERTTGAPRARPSALDPFLDYCRRQLTGSPHLPAAVLYADVVTRGYSGSYSSFTRAIRTHRLRPDCPSCGRGDGHAGSPVGPATREVPVQAPRRYTERVARPGNSEANIR